MDVGPEDPVKYRLPWEARFGRWWRRNRERIGLIVVGGTAVASAVAFLSGNEALGAGLAVVALLYLVYAYTNWFNDMS